MNDIKLLKFIHNNASESEQKEVLAWIEESEENKHYFSQLKNMNVALDILALENRQEKAAKRIIRKRIFGSIAKVAVVAAIIVGGFFLYSIGEKNATDKWQTAASENITVVEVPLGETVNLSLPDGSSVKLNSGSKLSFNSMYGVDDRRVKLDGEGYFKVKSCNKEFMVETSCVNITVLGTVFNVSAYTSEKSIRTYLYSGKVMVNNLNSHNTVYLKPNECYTYNQETGKEDVKNFERTANWTDSFFIADSDDIEVFAKKIERKYNVRIEIDSALIGTCRYTGVFKGENLEEILKNMSVASPIKYSIDKNGNVKISKQ